MQAADSDAHGALLCDHLYIVGAKTYLVLLNSHLIVGEQIIYNSASGKLKRRVRVPRVRTEGLGEWDQLQHEVESYLTKDLGSQADFFIAARRVYRTSIRDPTASEAVEALLNELATRVVSKRRTGKFAVQFSSYRVYPGTLQPIDALL